MVKRCFLLLAALLVFFMNVSCAGSLDAVSGGQDGAEPAAAGIAGEADSGADAAVTDPPSALPENLKDSVRPVLLGVLAVLLISVAVRGLVKGPDPERKDSGSVRGKRRNGSE